MKKLLIASMCLLSFNVQAFEQGAERENERYCGTRANKAPEDNLGSHCARTLEEKTHNIAIDIQISSPMSPELINFINSIPPAGNYSSSFEEWKASFINSMNQLIKLVEREKVFKATWSAKTDVPPSVDAKQNLSS